ncbi:OmpA family protein [Aurantibacter aestuarii]|uniref:OmpA family protein n=1 Tax=Aurantibacter aestuarii TaxID=1266046 RepID=A0A2T1NDG1_9FLAO|nr:OmpA family protein [Aurantibacter aestuarii]PSG90483.1 OmpA family protein [Aurantibacter aestuarii]
MRILNILFLLSVGFCYGQNLVVNPSFEICKSTPESIGQFDFLVTSWNSPNYGSTDYFKGSSKTQGFLNYRGFQEAKSGNSYVGCYLLSEDNYREYIQGKLSSILEFDTEYTISFYISLAEESMLSIKNIDIMLVSENASDYEYGTFIDINLKKSESTLLKTNSKQFYSDKMNWIKVSSTYRARGFEKYFIIGNFNSDKNTVTKREPNFKKKKDHFAYYYIDEISVIENKTATIEDKKTIEILTFQPEKTYTFKNVLFDFDKAELLDVSIEELDKLYQHLEENKTLNITIYGHTDNVGLDSRNKELSEQRAEAVSNYFIQKGLNPERVKWFGFGADAPLTTNDTEENRAKNRRVEFKLSNK